MQICECRKKLYQKTWNSFRWLVVCAMTWLSVWIGGWGGRHQNITEVAVTQLGANGRLCIFNFWKELFTTVSAAKNGDDVFYLINVIFKTFIRNDYLTEGQWRSGTVHRFNSLLHWGSTNSFCRGLRLRSHGSQRGGEQLEARSQWSVKREGNSSRKVPMPTQVFRSTAIPRKCINWPEAVWAFQRGSFTSKTVMWKYMSVTRLLFLCRLTHWSHLGSDICDRSQTSTPLWVGKMTSIVKVLLTGRWLSPAAGHTRDSTAPWLNRRTS